jgi:ribonucleoside-diphosphate reductase beta chain
MAAKAEVSQGTTQTALRRMAAADPELGALMVLQSMPAAAAPLPESLSYRLEIDGLGAWRVTPNGAAAELSEVPAGAELDGDEFAIVTDPGSLARLASGQGLLGLLLSRRLRLRGRRRKALALRRLSRDAGPRELAKLGAAVDPDLLYRSLPYAIDPEWTRGHNFRIGWELVGEGGGRWHLDVRDGELKGGRGFGDGDPDTIIRFTVETWQRLLRGELTPTEAMQLSLTEIGGEMYPAILVGRWIDRAEGIDAPELEREERQRLVQERRAGTWGSPAKRTGSGASDPAEEGRPRGGLMSYEQLYALWEKQNWRAHEIDFSVDKDQWLAAPTEAQRHNTFSLGSFYVGEERVTADLAPFLLGAPSGEVEAFLATQLVDEMRHAVFFDRWMAEVVGVESDDMRSRLREIEETMLTLPGWHFLFDDSLRDVANRIKARPDDLELFVEGIVTYHIVTEGVLAMPAQRVIIQYTDVHDLYPGFNTGFRLVERDEHRHIAFGVRFLKDVCDERPEMKKVVVGTLEKLLPRAAETFMPPEADDPADFWSYGLHCSQVYGFSYMALKRRMAAIGVEIPPPERLMPGPVDFSGLDERYPFARGEQWPAPPQGHPVRVPAAG